MWGVLVAVSIPIFTSQLEKSREATDVANMRAAKAAAVTAYLSEEAPVYVSNAVVTDTLYYDAGAGKLVSAKPTGYGKGTENNAGNTELGYDRKKRNDALRKLKTKGLTIRQIERLTGINRNIVQKA